MAIRLADYFPNHQKRIMVFAMCIQIASYVAIGAILHRFTILPLWQFIIIIVFMAIAQSLLLFVLIRLSLEPLGYLSRAITHVSKQLSDVEPPNLNGTRHEKTGLKDLVQTIYNLAVGSETSRQEGLQTRSVHATLIDSLPVGVIAFDEKRAVLYANKNAPTHTDEQGTEILDLLFDNSDSLSMWLDKCEAQAVSDYRVWANIPNALPDTAGRRLYDVAAKYEKGGTGGVDLTLVAVDRTEKYISNEEDMDFIALAAHELRGPITVIRGYLDVLSEEIQTVITPDQQNLLDRLNVSSNRLSSYVSNILNVARYDRRHLKLHLTEDNVVNIYNSIADDLQLRASTQNRHLSVQLPSDLPAIAADRNSLSEVIANLVDNAIKYSNEGGNVLLTARVEGEFVVVSVEDNGIGIPSSIIGHLFTKFYRSHRSRQSIAGTGLGLYIAKGIIESHGGRVGVKSTEGQGSVFSFSVPIYATVKDKLLASGNSNSGIIESSSGWIKNHNMYNG